MFADFYAGSDLLTWPLAGLGIFLASFLAVLYYVAVVLRSSSTVDRMANLPLAEDEDPVSPREELKHD